MQSPSGRSRRLAWWAAFAAAGSIALLAADPRSRLLAANTALLAGAVSLASVVVGAPLAFLLSRTDVAGRRVGTVALVTLLLVPLYLQAAAWQAAFGPIGWFTAASGGAAVLDGWRGAIAVHTLAAIPWVVVITAVGLRLAEPELEEEALLDATPAAVFRHVTLRRAADAAATAALWVAVSVSGEMTVTDLFQIRTYAEEIYTQFALGDDAAGASWKLFPSLLAISWAIIAGLVIILRLMPRDHHPSQRQRRVFRLGRWHWLASALALSVVASLVGLPVASLVVKAGRVVTHDAAGLVRTWSAEQCFSMLAESPLRFRDEFIWSTAIAALASATAIAIALPLAWSARAGGRRAMMAWALVTATLALPGPLVGLGLIAIFNGPNWQWLGWLYDHSIAAVWLAQSVRALPLCLLVLWYGLRTIPVDLLASATLEGASPLARLLRVVLPQRWPVVAAAAIVAFAIAWGELAASILVVPPGVTTLPIQIFGLIHYGVDDRLAGLSLVVMAAVAVIGAALVVLVRLAQRHENR